MEMHQVVPFAFAYSVPPSSSSIRVKFYTLAVSLLHCHCFGSRVGAWQCVLDDFLALSSETPSLCCLHSTHFISPHPLS